MAEAIADREARRKQRARRHALTRAAIYILGFVPAAWTFYLGATDQLGADPVKTFEHALGIWTLRFLIITLLVTPLREMAGLDLLRYRRAFGLLAFWYAAMHLATYMVLDQALNLAVVVEDVIKRPFIMIGMASFVMLIPLAITSNDWSVRKLGRRWGRLHKLVYLAAAGGAIHFIMGVKSWPLEPLIYAAIVAVLLLYRLLPTSMRTWRRRRDGRRRTARREARSGSAG